MNANCERDVGSVCYFVSNLKVKSEEANMVSSSKRAMREVSARVSMFAEHFDCIKVCKPGAARNAGELQRKKAGGLPMGQQFTNAAKTDVRRGGIFNDASKGWNI